MKKYKLIDRRNGFYRVKALKDILRYGVKAGDLGGYVEKEENLSQVGDCWISADAYVCNNAHVYGNAYVSGNVTVCGTATVCGDARVYGNAQVYGNAWVRGNAQVWGNARVFGNSVISSRHDIVTLDSLRHSITATNVGIALGCEAHNLAEWKEKYREIGEREGYSYDEQRLYLKLIITAYKIYLAQQELK